MVKKLTLVCFAFAVIAGIFAPVVSHAQPVNDFTRWENTWFKLTLSATMYRFTDQGSNPAPSTPVLRPGEIRYMKVIGWDPASYTFTADLFRRNDLGAWDPLSKDTLELVYYGGSDLGFVCTTALGTESGGMNLALIFKGKWKDTKNAWALDGATKVLTAGSYFLDTTDGGAPAPEWWAGKAKLKGPMVPDEKVPDEIK